ncbi:cytochrome ubiquinol oxidase subunit I [uncultured Cellulomonas sp.]|uniref:cytochrome ubiquinol oxidase subunit I n=1 Tax=uncultured Cellulomonas sp. TaxID=189682 RepID=UPI00262B3953|nr:cytochrome ubiquinol oxidase subunit I [uncultured Cellulomonas sp.]
MNVPVGFRLVDREVTDVQTWAVLFSPAAFWQFAHMWLAAYMVVSFTIAGGHAVGMLRGRRDRRHRRGFQVALASAAALIQPVVCHLLGGRLAEWQPEKLAAFELAVETESPSPLRLGGLLIDGEVRWAIDSPYLGSIIARNSLTEPALGLEAFSVDTLPPVNITHWAFQTMIAVGTLLALCRGGVLGRPLARRRRRRPPLIPAVHGDQRGAGGDRHGSRVDRHRGRPAALVRLRRDANGGGGR